jgi:hypothetical protein
MKTQVLKNILSNEDKSRIFKIVDEELSYRPVRRQPNPSRITDTGDTTNIIENYGRLEMKYINLPEDIMEKLHSIVEKSSDEVFPDLAFGFVIYAEYSKSYGKNPMLDPHFDISDVHTIILDYQLESNTSWEIAVESEKFILEDNSGLLFEPENNIHYRPAKNFQDDEFVKMLFIRFITGKDAVIHTNEEHMRLGKNQEIYNKISNSIIEKDTH